VTLLNAFLRQLVDLVMLLFAWAPAWLSLTFFSFVFAVLALLTYKRFSNQQAIEEIKDQIAASFFEIRLFNDDVSALLVAQRDLLLNNLRYMGHNLKPMIVMLVPMVLLIAQLEFLYGYRGLEVAKPAVLTATLDEEVDVQERPLATLMAAEGMRVDSAPVWIPQLRQMVWRIVGEKPGNYELEVSVDGAKATKNVVVSDAIVRRSPVRQRPGLLDQLLYPAEDPLDPELPFRSIEVNYESAEVSMLGIGFHWLIWMLILSILIAFALRKRFGVTF
jgi:uncharacterized membrane protein (DUF106 family)